MHVLVTRPSQDAEPLIARLGELGVAASAEPLFSIAIKEGAKPKLSGVQGLLATSANGIRAFAALEVTRELPVYAVGDATAQAAVEAGFERIESAGGDVEALAELVAVRVDPAKGALLHVAGTELSGNLGKTLKEKGFTYRRSVLYEATVATGLTSGTEGAIREGRLDGVLFFSPRTAERFVALARKARLVRACSGLSAFCLSHAVAEQVGAISWREVHVAERPDQETLLALLGKKSHGPRSEMSDSPKIDDPTEIVDETNDTDVTPKTIDVEAESETSVDEATPTSGAAAKSDEASAPETPADASPARTLTRRSVVPSVVIWVLLFVAVLGGAIYAAWPFWSPYADAYIQALQKDPFQDPRMDSLSERLAALEGTAKDSQPSNDALSELEARRTEISDRVGTLVARVNDLEGSLASVKQLVEATTLPLEAADARKSLDELKERIARLEGSDAVSGLKADIEKLGVESNRISASVEDISSRMYGLEDASEMAVGASGKVRETILAAEQLREVLKSAAPFASELQALRGAAGDKADLAKIANELAPFAGSGIPPLATLREGFDGVAKRIVAAANRMEGDGWVAAAVNRLSTLVSVRRTDAGTDENSVDAAVAKAEIAVREGNLMGAVTALQSLDGAPAEAVAPWLADAHARVIAEHSMAVLHVHAVSMMTPSSATPAEK